MPETIPDTQHAVQLVGPGELKLNTSKPVDRPGPTQILAKVEAVGLCFSDLKLLKQFTDHARKGEIVSGLDADVLAEIPSYVPGEKPTVPGHEAVCRIVAVGEKVARHKVGERVLVQTDYRTLKTAKSNAAFGYNFEGGLQEYVLMDERVVIEPGSDERFLIPVGEEFSASAVALVEPWACVEDSYVTHERRAVKPGGRLLVVAEAGFAVEGLAEALDPQGRPAEMLCICAEQAQQEALGALAAGLQPKSLDGIDAVEDQSCDDVVYFGAEAENIEKLNDKLAASGILCVVTGGRKIGRKVSIDVGRVHYGMTRLCGTETTQACDAYDVIPETGEIRDNESISVVGAGGPMGQMHVIRDICTGHANVEIVASDFDSQRLESLSEKAAPLARANGVKLRMVNPQETPLEEAFSYHALMAPVAPLVAGAVEHSKPNCLINIFAGIPAGTRQELDLDTFIAHRCFMFGTSGSEIRDMKIVLEKVRAGRLDTDRSVDAVGGLAGAIDGIAAVENRTLAGKIIVYPELRNLPLIPLSKIGKRYPSVAEKLDAGIWTREAERELLRVAQEE